MAARALRVNKVESVDIFERTSATSWRRKKMDNVTASEIAGLGVGTLLLCAAISAPKVDAFISASQRSSLGMCKRCGNLQMIACTKCRGVGSIKDGLLPFGILNDLYEWIDSGESKAQSSPCKKCRGRGHFNCPDCFKT